MHIYVLVCAKTWQQGFFLESSSTIESWSSLRFSHIRHDCFVPWLETLALRTQSNTVGGGMHGGGLQTTNTHTKKKHYQLGYICLCILQLSVSRHWCNTHTLTVESTLLLYPDHLAGLPISTSAVYSHVCCGLNVRVDSTSLFGHSETMPCCFRTSCRLFSGTHEPSSSTTLSSRPEYST